jgi:hypothetical protein
MVCGFLLISGAWDFGFGPILGQDCGPTLVLKAFVLQRIILEVCRPGSPRAFLFQPSKGRMLRIEFGKLVKVVIVDDPIKD